LERGQRRAVQALAIGLETLAEGLLGAIGQPNERVGRGSGWLATSTTTGYHRQNKSRAKTNQSSQGPRRWRSGMKSRHTVLSHTTFRVHRRLLSAEKRSPKRGERPSSTKGVPMYWSVPRCRHLIAAQALRACVASG